MTDAPRIRPAHSGDAEAVAALHAHGVQHSLATFTTVVRGVSDWAEDILSGQPMLIAEDRSSGRFLGFATFGPFRGGPGYAHTAEHSIYLTEAARGRGVGRALLRDLENLARVRGLHVLVAAISGANPSAQAFHAACGYREVARLAEVGCKWGQWLDLVLMQKILREDEPARPDSQGDPG
ncbi:GNAT family N-acetyltransferase [Phaeobacter sp. B1627]|uniref:GNAT family N-acetyltransferase n=1 Tax=Phaeobacter sp. B1627 TaxID=2583809 RepID=UPI00111912E2|nr:GNAT family N-acetyltransferase [Phaeobacter sp. B1627]TNJ48201.1 N-acetyltransferase family protein [Phaeobacter sp. B1627]